MSGNSLKVLLIFILATPIFASNSTMQQSAHVVQNNSEDALIVQAIFDEDDGNYTKSRDIYEKLFALTGKREYLIREAQDALIQKRDIAHSIANLTHWVTEHPTDHDRNLYLLLAALYIQNDSLQDADEIIDAYLTKGNADAMDLLEFGSLKIQLGEYKDALDLLLRAYRLSPDEDTLKQISALYILKMKEPQKAVEILQKYIDKHPEASIGIYFHLIELYAKENRLGKVLELYKKLYLNDPQKYFLQKIIEISLYQKDTDGLIQFLEKTKGNEELLYSAYKSNGLYDKALALAEKMFASTTKPKWKAEEAILLYEEAQKRHDVTPELLKKVERLFDDAIASGVTKGVYLNYYGYTLIDHDLDIDKGIGLVRRALGKDHNNIFYIDSLAWGLYKKGLCQKAYKLMLRVVKGMGLKEQVIKDHYKAIKACKSSGHNGR